MYPYHKELLVFLHLAVRVGVKDEGEKRLAALVFTNVQFCTKQFSSSKRSIHTPHTQSTHQMHHCICNTPCQIEYYIKRITVYETYQPKLSTTSNAPLYM